MRHSYAETLRKIQEVKIHMEGTHKDRQVKARTGMARALDLCPDPSLRAGLNQCRVHLDRLGGVSGDLFMAEGAKRDLLASLTVMEKILTHRAERAARKQRSQGESPQGGPAESASRKDPQPVVTFLERSQPKEADE